MSDSNDELSWISERDLVERLLRELEEEEENEKEIGNELKYIIKLSLDETSSCTMS